MTRKSSVARKAEPASAQHRWHLATDDFGVKFTDLEYALLRVYQSFVRWQSECLAGVTGLNLSGEENALLHVIRMHDRPKTIKELMQLTNRQDTANMQYDLRKLLKAELIDKYGSARSGIYYVVTPQGVDVCDAYAKLRSETLLETAKSAAPIDNLASDATRCMEQLERLYESCTREVATFHRRR
jgi:predicted MarR family transcription regulator